MTVNRLASANAVGKVDFANLRNQEGAKGAIVMITSTGVSLLIENVLVREIN